MTDNTDLIAQLTRRADEMEAIADTAGLRSSWYLEGAAALRKAARDNRRAVKALSAVAPRVRVGPDVIDRLRENINGAEMDMAADAEDAVETGERVDLAPYEVAVDMDDAKTIIAALALPAVAPGVPWTRAQQIAFARAYDTEDAAQRGEPTPWISDEDADEWVDERIACVRAGLAALDTPAPALMEELVDALRCLAVIADAFDENELDDEARKHWTYGTNETPHDQIELYQGRGGKRLMTLAHCMTARAVLAKMGGAE